MKRNFLYKAFIAITLTGIVAGCSDFGNTNLDPEHLNDGNINYNMVFTNAQHQASGSDNDVWTNGIIYGATMMQHATSVEWSEVFYTYNAGYNSGFWSSMYSGNRASVRDLKIVLNAWKDKPEYATDYQIGRIMKAYVFHRMTDLYGDVPYSEAAAGIDYPKYDKQQDIYADLLKELNEAQENLKGGTSQLGSADLYYNGDITMWRKFANSLMLRIAMRMSKVSPAEAEKWVKIAVANGLFETMEESAVLQHTDGDASNDSSEPYGKVYSQRDAGKFYLSDYFVSMLKNTEDPRLPLIGTVCTQNPRITYTSKGYDKGITTPEKQVGMPVGYDLNGGDWDIKKSPGYPGNNDPDFNFRTYYSTINRYTYSDPQAPTMILTYAENQLLLAEAAYRGWLEGTNVSQNAQKYYETGVRSAMKQFSFYANAKSLYDTYLSDTAIEKYLADHPFDMNKALEQINTQYYIATFCDEYETFANWRRSGYPKLVPVKAGYPNSVTNGTIPRRFTYPTSEAQNNSSHYKEGVSGLTPAEDKMTSRMWWDVE